MANLQQVQAEYELSKYLQLFRGDEAPVFAGDVTLRGSLNDRVELTILRLAVQGAFLVLTDASRLHIVADGHRTDAKNGSSQVEFDSGDDVWSLVGDTDRSTWISLFQEIVASKAPENASVSQEVFSIPTLGQDARTSKLSAVSGPAKLSFFAGVPLTANNGHNIGAICVVDSKERPSLATLEAEFLIATARRCMDLLELARERGFYNRWTAMQEELDIFLESGSLRAQLLEEPQNPIGHKSSGEKTGAGQTKEHDAKRIEPKILAQDLLASLSDPPAKGGESERLINAEIERDYRIAARDNAQDAQSPTAKRGRDDERGLPKGETTYRKVFRKAAQCLRSALKADGVLFVDGLIGFHGEVQPVAEPEQELQREIGRPPVHRSQSASTKAATDRPNDSNDIYNPHSPDPSGTHTRIYSSSEYLKGVYIERPAEILGLSGASDVLNVARVSESTLGLVDIDEGFLQRLMDRHPSGVVWHSSNSSLMQVKDETLVEIDLEEEEHRLTSTFRNVRQLIFKPLTDPTSLKRLGACFAWRMKSVPVFTDDVDLGSLTAFVHVVESEIARYNASHVAKQKETFVSSVSHELRTPLHGILGAVQLLDESGLDPMQKSLADMITTCGSTLHETLTSVLSYAKINQFERRQHQYRYRRPPDATWALSDEQGRAAGPDRDYEGLYICTNLAMLCEEILGVLEAGKSFQNSHAGDVIVVCNIKYEENWSYYTEPGALQRIAVNLIGNALKYTTSGSVIVTLSASKEIKDPGRVSNDLDTGRTVIIHIQDTGKGMSRDFMDNQLFLPFTQEDSTSTNGVGLGMSIVKSLISLLGGEIQVQSEENKGTEISVRIPMRMCRPDDDERGHATVQFDKDIQTIRDRKLSVVMYGFPDYVRKSLTNYLCDWYYCTLLEPTENAKPDIVLVDEGNEDVLEAVKETAYEYGKHAVLLSIVMVPSRLGKRMDTIEGYIKWERVPRPLGPNNVAKGLLSCLEKLDELRKHGENASVDKRENKEEPQPKKRGPESLQELKKSLSDDQYMSSLERLRISGCSQSLLPVSKSPPGDIQRKPSKEMPDQSIDQKVEPKLESKATLRILIVDDNALNLRLLGAFFKKNGYRNIQQAKHGKAAVEAVQNYSESFDIIFMDLSMPVMDGFEATRQIRKMEAGYERAPATQESVIIALTGLASQADEDRAFNAGVDLFLTKPVQFPNLSDLLRQYEEGTLRRRRRPGGGF